MMLAAMQVVPGLDSCSPDGNILCGFHLVRLGFFASMTTSAL
jgi:hypothetical protein